MPALKRRLVCNSLAARAGSRNSGQHSEQAYRDDNLGGGWQARARHKNSWGKITLGKNHPGQGMRRHGQEDSTATRRIVQQREKRHTHSMQEKQENQAESRKLPRARRKNSWEAITRVCAFLAPDMQKKKCKKECKKESEGKRTFKNFRESPRRVVVVVVAAHSALEVRTSSVWIYSAISAEFAENPCRPPHVARG
jgi:hypothetical protein